MICPKRLGFSHPCLEHSERSYERAAEELSLMLEDAENAHQAHSYLLPTPDETRAHVRSQRRVLQPHACFDTLD